MVIKHIKSSRAPQRLGKKVSRVSARVTRLGEFSPNGRLFTLGNGLKITEVVQISGLLFSALPVLILKKMFGPHFGRLFHNLIWSPWFRQPRNSGPPTYERMWADLCRKNETMAPTDV
jgi:hypothetical protein